MCAISPGRPLDLLNIRLAIEYRGQGRIELQQFARVRGTDPARIEAMPLNPEVGRTVEILLSVRGRKEMVRHLDRGDFFAAMSLSSACAARLSQRYCPDHQAEIGEATIAFEHVVEAHRDAPPSGATQSLARKRASNQQYAKAWRR